MKVLIAEDDEMMLKTVEFKKLFEKAVQNRLTALKIRQKLVSETPFIFISKCIDEENTVALIKNRAIEFVYL